jgi:MFS family permease
MQESPLFSKLKSEGKTSTNPLKESFRNKTNFKMVLLALFGAVMGQGVIWYTGQFYAQSFLETKCGIEFEQSRTIMLWGIALATPFFLFFGWLSDRIGRKWIMLGGMLLGVLLYRPIFSTFLADTDIAEWQKTKYTLVDETVKKHAYKNDSLMEVYTRYKTPEGAEFTRLTVDTITHADALQSMVQAQPKATYINKKVSTSGYVKFVALIWVMILLVTMVYGPIAAFLVEMFPTKIRYTSMSLPYHIGNGVFGGLVPFIGLLLTTTYPKDPLVGLWYPIGIAALCFIIGSIYLKNGIDKDVND